MEALKQKLPFKMRFSIMLCHRIICVENIYLNPIRTGGGGGNPPPP